MEIQYWKILPRIGRPKDDLTSKLEHRLVWPRLYNWAIIDNNATILRGQNRQTAKTLLEDNIIIRHYIGDNTWTSEKNNKIHIKKFKEKVKETQ